MRSRAEKEGRWLTSTPRIADPGELPDERDFDKSLRPKRFDDFVGQSSVKEQLQIFVQAARNRGDTLDHVLLAGPPGLGKTTLAGIIANELEVNVHTTSGPAIERKVDIAGILTNLQRGDVLFVDEIHRLNVGRRRGPLPGDGGLRDRHHDRRRAGGAQRAPLGACRSRSSARRRAPGC